MSKPPESFRSSTTRQRILEAALALFRKRGFDRTTMRDVATKAGVALGAAYYYFRSKNDIVAAYYDRLRLDNEGRVATLLQAEPDLRKRLGAVFHTSLDLLKRDRKLIAGIFRSVGEVDAVSPFSPETSGLRARSIQLFEDALSPAGLPPPTTRLVATGLWGGHMAMILYMMHDTSKGQEKTRQLVDGLLDALVPVLPILPALGPTLDGISRTFEAAGLVAPGVEPPQEPTPPSP
jgi:AcrR family transcriptional regulator